MSEPVPPPARPERSPAESGSRIGGTVAVCVVLILAVSNVAYREAVRNWDFFWLCCALAFFGFLLCSVAGAGFGWFVGLFVRKPAASRAVIWAATGAVGVGVLAFFAEMSWRNRRDNPPNYPAEEEKAVVMVQRRRGEYKQDFGRPQGFQSVVAVKLRGDEVDDADLKKLTALRSLTSLSVHCRRVTDTGMKELAAIPSLTHLELNATQVTDAGLRELTTLPNLAELHLYKTRVTDAGMRLLRVFPKLTHLDLTNTAVTDAGTKDLATLTNLTKLGLSETEVTDRGLAELAPLKNLTALELRRTQVTDAGLKVLVSFTKLTVLHLNDRITDAGLEDLVVLRELAELHLYDSKVTDAGAGRLQTALPGCKINLHK